MEQTGPLGHHDIQAKLSCHHARHPADLDGMLENILAIAGAIAQTAEQFDDFRMDSDHARFKDSSFTFCLDGGIHFFTGFVDHLFNPGWMNTAVDDQFFQSDPGNFAPDRVKAGQNHSFRRVVDDQVNTCHGFDGPDIASFSTDDAAFHFVTGQSNN